MKNTWILGGVVAVLSSMACSGPVTAPSAVGGAGSASVAVASASHTVGEVPFRGTFSGQQTVTPRPPFPPTAADVAVSVTGSGTQIGRFSMELPHVVNFTTSSATGTATIVAANGDTIVATFTGQAIVGPIVSIREVATIVSGTGRFSGATGTFTIVREYVPAEGTTSGTFEGVISAPGRP